MAKVRYAPKQHIIMIQQEYTRFITCGRTCLSPSGSVITAQLFASCSQYIDTRSTQYTHNEWEHCVQDKATIISKCKY